MPSPEAKRRYRQKNREYYLVYMRQYRAKLRSAAGLQPSLDQCPSCHRRKSVKNDLCRRCGDKASTHKRQHNNRCWVCQVSMRSLTWHEKTFLRCPSCGLEVKTLGSYVVKEKAA